MRLVACVLEVTFCRSRGLGRKLRLSERLIVADMSGQQVDVIVKTLAALD
jgi:hypothetical protein